MEKVERKNRREENERGREENERGREENERGIEGRGERRKKANTTTRNDSIFCLMKPSENMMKFRIHLLHNDLLPPELPFISLVIYNHQTSLTGKATR